MSSSETIEAPTRTWRETVRVCGAWVLVAGCLLLLGTVIVAAERPTSYDDLSSAVARGDLDEVTITGGMAESSGDGFALAEVHWRKGPVRRVTEVVEATSRRAVSESAVDAPLVRGRVGDYLTDLDPTLRVNRGGDLRGHGEFQSWRVPSWAASLSFFVWIGLLVLLVTGPQPWRATRWAWFWLMAAVPPLGMLAFPLLGGATRLWPPARPEARLTGGWAFLFFAVVGLGLSTIDDLFL